MENAKIKCHVCGKSFDPSKELRYTARSNTMFRSSFYDAFDCPFCGCQYIAQERKVRFVDDEETQEDVTDDQEGV